MTIAFEERPSDSPYIQTVMRGWTVTDGAPIRPAEIRWHMVVRKYQGDTQLLVVGPCSSAGIVRYDQGAELLWIRFKIGTFMPHMPTRKLRNTETTLTNASSNAVWLKGSAWQIPDYENVEGFVQRLVHEEILVADPIVNSALSDQLEPQSISARTLRHRFLQATGAPQSHIDQFLRAQKAAALLQQGGSILDTVYAAGYFDQPHLTRSLKQFFGYTPGQILRNGDAG